MNQRRQIERGCPRDIYSDMSPLLKSPGIPLVPHSPLEHSPGRVAECLQNQHPAEAFVPLDPPLDPGEDSIHPGSEVRISKPGPPLQHSNNRHLPKLRVTDWLFGSLTWLQATGIDRIGRVVADVAVEFRVPGPEPARVLLPPGARARIVDAVGRTEHAGITQEGQAREGHLPRVGRTALTGDVAKADRKS